MLARRRRPRVAGTRSAKPSQVGAVLATLLEAGEAAPAQPSAIAAAHGATRSAPPRRGPSSCGAGDRSAAVAEPRRTGRWVSPAARRLAESARDRRRRSRRHRPAGGSNDITTSSTPSRRRSNRKAKPTVPPIAQRGCGSSIAAAMSRSKREIPHYYLAARNQLETALAWLTARNASGRSLSECCPAVLQLKAVALAAQRFGEFNGFWRDDAFHASGEVHVRRRDFAARRRPRRTGHPRCGRRRKLDDLMGDLMDLVARARAGSLRSSEMSDPTITVTNLGDQGVDAVFGVIYPPQVALVGFGTAGATSLRGHRRWDPCRSPQRTLPWQPTTALPTVIAAPCSSPPSTSSSNSPMILEK